MASRRGIRAAAFAAIASVGLAGARAPAAPRGLSAPRTIVQLDAGWTFGFGAEFAGAEKVAFDDSRWTRVNVPHTWNRLGNAGRERSPLTDTRQGVGWYRLRFRTAREMRDRRYYVEFSGVGAIADVWLNGHYLGNHRGAFSRFRFDATDAIQRADENLLVVKADNSRPEPGSATADVIPLSGDFFVFGGLYRGVRLITTSGVHLDLLDMGGPGLYARTLAIEGGSARVEITGKLVNDTGAPVPVRVATTIEDETGATVAADPGTNLTLPPAGSSITAELRLPHPRLWRGIRDPYLYRVRMTLRSPGGAVLDRLSQPLGVRTVAFHPNEGFLLNGSPLPLRGASMHQDRPVKGWAVSRADVAEDFDILCDLGANAVRLAHYQHDETTYDLADSRGIVAWAEIPLVDKVSFDGTAAGSALAANARQQLAELIRQNFNHPSIVVWSIANEADLTATLTHGPGRAAALIESLNVLAHQEDPGRATTLADCCENALVPGGAPRPDDARRDVLVGLTDTVGYNRYFGWYYGDSGDLGAMLDAAHTRHPTLPIAVSEYGAGAAFSQHTDDAAGGPINPHGRPHPEEFASAYHEASWRALEARRYLWGVFIWNLFDFASAARREGDSTDLNDKGLVSYDRRVRKDAYFFYRANWSSRPTLHLTGSRYRDRPYGVTDVTAYSNAPSATLWVNGTRAGETPCTGGTCRWTDVRLRPGANQLSAEAIAGGKTVNDAIQWNYRGVPDVVRIKAGDLAGYVSRDGERFGSDAYFVGGRGQGVNLPDAAEHERRAVSAPDPGLYDSFRSGAFAYRVPVPPGNYRVVARFAEPAALATGEREFDVVANGRTVIAGFDVFAAAGGRLRAVDRDFVVEAKDGALLIEFRPRRGEAIVSALSVEPADRSTRDAPH